MAMLVTNDKLKQDNNQAQQGGADNLSGGSQVGAGALVGSTSNVVSGGTGGQASAPGGQGAWTNIQAYLNANKNNTGSAQYFDNKVNSVFDEEKNKAQSEADKTKNEAKEAVDKANIGTDQASKIIQDTAKNYSYSGEQTEPYTSGVGQLENAIYSEFTGPTTFNYALSDEAQKYGNVGDNQAFKTIMENLYNESAGGQMSRGQLALQRQLDVGNQKLAQARNNAVDNFAGLNTYVDDLATTTTEELGGLQNQFTTNQNNLITWLNNQANLEMQAKNQAEADAKKAYNTTYTTDKSGKNTWTYGTPIVDYSGNPEMQNMTWQQAQGYLTGIAPVNYGSYQNMVDANEADVSKALNSFYDTQNKKYYNTGDVNKRAFNTIMDILNKENRLEEGFKVKG